MNERIYYERIRNLREDRDLSQKYVAEEILHVSQRVI